MYNFLLKAISDEEYCFLLFILYFLPFEILSKTLKFNPIKY